MRAPRGLRAWISTWSELSSAPFDPASPLAQGFSRFPSRSWAGAQHEGRSVLGWIWERGWGYPPRPKTDQLAWISHALTHGARATSALNNRLGSRSLVAQAAHERRADVLEAVEASGQPLFVRPGYTDNWVWPEDVLALGRLSWSLGVLSENAYSKPLGACARISAYASNPALSAHTQEVAEALLSQGQTWLPGDLQDLALAALRSPSPFWLAAFSQVLSKASSPPPGWGQSLANGALLLASTSTHAKDVQGSLEKLKEAMEAVLPPDQRAAWRPSLPTGRWPGLVDPCKLKFAHTLNRDRREKNLGAEKPLGRLEWAAVSALVHWACDWGVAPRERTEHGVPWLNWLAWNMYWSHDFSLYADKPDKAVAWNAMERLLRAGVKPSYKVVLTREGTKYMSQVRKATLHSSGVDRAPASSLHDLLTRVSPYRAPDVDGKNFGFDGHWGHWPRLYRGVLMSLRWEQAVPLAPAVPSRPRL